MDKKQKLEELAGTVSTKISGDWHHYQCFMCADTSQHLGINVENGAVKCLRCGFKWSMNKKQGHDAKVIVGIDPDLFTFESHPDYEYSDSMVRNYLSGRGVIGKTGWAYGRGKIAGLPVFPSVNHRGEVNYIQWRYIGEGNQRYRSVKHTIPRFDFYPILQPNVRERQTIILVEGPVDAHVVRAETGTWCSTMYGTNPGTHYLRDLCVAVEMYDVNRVLLMLDNDNTGHTRSEYFYYKLKYEYGINVGVVKIRGKSEDPADKGGIEALYKHLRRK